MKLFYVTPKFNKEYEYITEYGLTNGKDNSGLKRIFNIALGAPDHGESGKVTLTLTLGGRVYTDTVDIFNLLTPASMMVNGLMDVLNKRDGVNEKYILFADPRYDIYGDFHTLKYTAEISYDNDNDLYKIYMQGKLSADKPVEPIDTIYITEDVLRQLYDDLHYQVSSLCVMNSNWVDKFIMRAALVNRGLCRRNNAAKFLIGILCLVTFIINACNDYATFPPVITILILIIQLLALFGIKTK